MNIRVLGVLIAVLSLIGGMFGLAQYMKGGKGTDQSQEAKATQQGDNGSGEGLGEIARGGRASSEAPIDPLAGAENQTELEELSKKYLSDIKADHRLNLKMATQLRAYEDFLSHLKNYAEEVERDLQILEQISQDSFQEDVSLQASLFSGKKPETVATHLEKFRSSRVGAILAKMKDKEAGKVLDIWAEKEDPRVNLFYQEVMVSYLKNKRYDSHPELLKEFKKRNKEIAELPKEQNAN